MIKSHDINVIKFHIAFDGLELTADHTVKVLSVFSDTGSQTNVNCEIVDGKAIYRLDTSLISQYDYVLNYVYVYRGDQSLDAHLFTYSVDSSKIDETAIKIKTVYDQSYAELLTEFEARLQDYKDSLPQASELRAEVDVILDKFKVDSDAKLSQYDTDAQQVIADNQTAFDLAESNRQSTYEQAEDSRNQASEQAVVDWEQGADALLETVEDNETVRVDAEATRKSNETTRISNENARKSAEDTRQADFANAQSTRQAEFESSELDRQAKFLDSEATREVSEGERVSSEQIREANELDRVSSENIRKANETGRQAGYIEMSQQIDAHGDYIEGIEDELLRRIDDSRLILGVYWDKSANPVLTRTDDAVGLVANVGKDGELVQNDFDTVSIYREIGDVVDEFGNEFVQIPKFYIQKSQGADYYRLRISKTKYPGFYLPKVFWDFENEKELEYYLHGKYKASISADGTKLESKFGEYPLVNKNIVQFRTLAQANNTLEAKGYQQLDIHAQDVISALFTIEFATLHSQSVMQGYTTGRYTNSDLAIVAEMATNRFILPNATADQYRVGQTISLGTSQGGSQIAYGRTITAIEVYDVSNKAIVFDSAPVDIAIGNNVYNTGWKNGFSKAIAASSGYVGANDGKYPCSYRGIESPWGDLWQWVDGVNINDNQTWVAMDAEKYASNVFSDPYNKIGYVNSTENGYPKKMGFDPQFPFANLAVEMGAGSSTYYADYYYQASGQRVARVGGYWHFGSAAGLWYWTLDSSPGSARVSFGGRLLKKAL